ncbi:hypothetical protein BH09VER1_BH09VER1_13250 [soil metagenome]
MKSVSKFGVILAGLSLASCDKPVTNGLPSPTPVAAATPKPFATPTPPVSGPVAAFTPKAARAFDNVTVNVPAGGRQAFGGFGTSEGNWEGEYQKLTPEQRQTLSEMLWRDLKFKTLRLLINTDQYAAKPGEHNISSFRRQYVDSGMIADAKKQGVTILLLQPDSIPIYMRDTSHKEPQLKDSEIGNYAALIADSIKQIKTETGVLMDATGVQNEPNGLERVTPDQIPKVVSALRTELDRNGLQSVKIIAPEQSSVDGVYYEQIEKLKKDPAAWKALYAVASHSYNMAATDQAADLIAAPNGENLKEYWMTEASENGSEQPGNIFRAVSLASRFLNDVNHRMTHWMHFLGFEKSDPKDNGTRIIAFTASPFSMQVFLKYYVFQQFANAFDVGAIFRASQSEKEGSMTWTFGKKPRITAATAKNPDGSWAVGISNFTADSFSGVQGWGDDNWNKAQGGYTPGQGFNVTIRIDEAKSLGSIPFTVHRTSASLQNAEEGTVIMKDGEVTVPVGPLEVVTLRSGVAPGVAAK